MRNTSTHCRARISTTLIIGRRDCCETLKKLPELRDQNSDQQDKGLQAKLVIDRDTASRLGITPQTLDNALYDAFGQRQVSTMYRPLNQYHVVMEVAPQFQQTPEALQNIYLRSTAEPCAVSGFYTLRALEYASRGKSPGAGSVGDDFIQSRARSFSRTGDAGD